MGHDSYISASGAGARLRDLDVLSNNLSNVGTPGYKRTDSVFRAVFQGAIQGADHKPTPGASGSAFVSLDLVGTDFGRGSIEHTGSPLNVMIDGPGFFEITTPDGPRYTRAGNFMLNRDGQLSTAAGQPVTGEGGPIVIRDNDAQIDTNGSVVDRNGNLLGRLKVVNFDRLQKLEREGQSLFRAREDAEILEVDGPQFIAESVEGSNVEAARELSTMVVLQRAYETNMRAMQVDDETTQRLIEGIR